MAYRKKTASKPARRRTSVRRAKSYRKPARESINLLQDLFIAGTAIYPATVEIPSMYNNNLFALMNTDKSYFAPSNIPQVLTNYVTSAKAGWKQEALLAGAAVASNYIGKHTAFGRSMKLKIGKRNLKLF